MKPKVLLLALLIPVFSLQIQAQRRSSVQATSSEISDNLDLRAVASIFGEARDLQDFERQLNDPDLQISNLDLNNDNQVDYLRVIETVENRTHLIIVQAVLDRDVYQDVATIDVERDQFNKVHVQVIGDSFLYGNNYIYEPVYYRTPVLYASFWRPTYRPYCSTWNWGYYPRYYRAWNPFPVFRYRNNITINLNINNNYNYVNYRRSNQAIVLYNSRRSNGYERLHPSYSFSNRNASVSNRYELDQQRTNRGTVAYANRRTTSDSRISNNESRSATSNDRSSNRRGSIASRSTSTNRSNPTEANSRSNENNRSSQIDYSNRGSRSASEARNQSSNRAISSPDTERSRPATSSRNSEFPSRRSESSNYSTRGSENNTSNNRSQNRSYSENKIERNSSNRSSSNASTAREGGRAPATSQTENQRGNSGRNENRRS